MSRESRKMSTPDEGHANRLSKLTLSSSLHQLCDSKYLQNANLQHHYHLRDHHHPTADQSAAIAQPQSLPIDPKPTPNTNPKPQHERQRESDPKNVANLDAKLAVKQREAKLDAVHVVVGNESCDLDSVVSCLLMFHIISKVSDEINGKDKSSRTLYIPLLNTTRELLEGKSEVLWFLERTLNIDKSFLTCRDDIDWAEIKRNGVEVLVTLVDHNYNDDFDRIGRIVEIIDHHQLQNPQWLMELQARGLRLTLDTAVGSCATLVAERLFYVYAEHHVSNEILMLIYGTVLLDTICLSETAKRFTRRDVYLLRKLDALLGPKRPARQQLYKELVEAKSSTRQELDFGRLMRRDLKVYKDKHNKRVAIASLFGMAAREALGLGAHSNELGRFLASNHFAALVIMGLIADPECPDSISRDLVLVAADEHQQLFGRLSEAFEAPSSRLDLLPLAGQVGACSRLAADDPEEGEALRALGAQTEAARPSTAAAAQTEPESAPGGCRTSIWQQRNVSSSRKVLAPLVLKVLHDGAEQ